MKSARDIMRKDKGLNGDLDRLPMLTWVMFLKFLDDLERGREEEATVSGQRYSPAIAAPYRWRDWAADEGGITGDALLAFISQDEVTRPDGSRGEGLLRYLRGLGGSNGDDRRDVIATVFKGVTNRMVSGYLLRDVINKVHGIHFTSTEEIHTLGTLYESMLREMRDAAGDSGEFYTPRPLVRLMVCLMNPRLGESVLDPACGTGGFLAEAFLHLGSQSSTVGDYEQLQRHTIFGGEAKPLPYLLAQMNLLLHGIEFPNIDPGNSLRVKVTEIGDRDRVDVILTNPPFGGEEEKAILGNFPADKQTAETALLFLELIMRKLRRAAPGQRGGRAAVIVPNGTLYTDGVAQRIREELLSEFNLHTVLRLPKGVFEPYTDIATNILFFDRESATESVWFYEHPLPPHRASLKGKTYSATDGLTYEEFGPLVAWWDSREPSDFAWQMSKHELAEVGFDLAQMHPKHAAISLPEPSEIVRTVRALETEGERVLTRLEQTIAQVQKTNAPMVRLRDILHPRSESIAVSPDTTYSRPRVRLHFRGARVRDRVVGSTIGTKNQTVMHTNDLVLSRIDARNGAMAIVGPDLEGAIATNDFPVFAIDSDRVVAPYLRYCLFQPSMLSVYEHLSRGSTNRRRLIVDRFLELEIPLPDNVDVQWRVADALTDAETAIADLREHLGGMEEALEDLIGSTLHHFLGENSEGDQ